MATIRFIVLLSLIFPVLASAQQEATIDQIMRLHRQALGGMDGIVSFITGTIDYKLESGERTGTMKAIHGRDGNYREIRQFGRFTTEAIYNDGQVYLINNSTGYARSYHTAAGTGLDNYYLNLYRSAALIFPLFYAESQMAADLSVLGQGQMGYTVQARYPDGTVRIFTLGTNMLIQHDTTQVRGEGYDLLITRRYSNYTDIKGAKLPRITTLTVEGTLTRGGQQQSLDSTTTMTLDNAISNSEPDNSLFYAEGPAFVASGTEVRRGPFTFVYAGLLPVGDDPESIQAADLDEDGHLDLVTGDDGRTTALFGDGTGTFPVSIELPGGGGSNEFALPVQWDGKGGLDILVASTASPEESLIAVINDGNREFSKGSTFKTGDFPEAIATADFNGDGNADLAAPHNRSGDLWIHLGDGAGGLLSSHSYPLSRRGENLAVGDFNNDSAPDVAVVDQQYSTVFINDGKGAFTAQEPMAAGDFPFCVIAMDIDQDGAIDLVAGNGGIFRDVGEGDLAVFMGKGDGTFSEATMLSAGASITSLTAADFDGDGDTDLAISSFGDHTGVLLENSNGVLTVAGSLPASWSPAAIVAADFDADGHMDIAIANEHDDSVTIWLNSGKQE